MTRVAKKKAVKKLRVVLYLAEGTFNKIEDLCERLNVHRADVLAIAVARFHSSELMRIASNRTRVPRSELRHRRNEETPCLAK